jgi:hypothetical protein
MVKLETAEEHSEALVIRGRFRKTRTPLEYDCRGAMSASFLRLRAVAYEVQ